MIKKKIKMDLSISNAPQVIYTVQGDVNTRNVVIDLYNAGAAWIVPEGTSGVVKFRKADGKGGIYDKLPNGFPAVVYEENSNQIEVSLAPQVLTFPGEVKAQVSLIYDNNIISTFSFSVLVQEDPSANAEKSTDYVNWDRYFIPQTSGASVGQYLKITKVDDLGRVIEVSPVDAPSGGGGDGMTTAQINALHGMFKVCLFDDSKDVDSAIAAFEAAFGLSGGEEEPDEPGTPDVPDIKTYSVSAELINVTSSNKATAVNENASYTTTLTAADGYKLDTISVIMGGVDVTTDVYSDGVISIPAVTGNVEIIASAVVIEEPSAELVTDGLLAYFDFRTATYNNAGSDGSTTIAATQGEGQLFAWANNGVKVQGERGINFSNTRPNMYSQAGNTTQTNIGTSMTLIMLTYGHVMDQGFTYENVGSRWAFKPKYKLSNGNEAYAEQRSGSGFNSDNKDDYNFCVYRVDGDTLTEVMDTSVTTYNGGNIDGFESWITTVGIGMIRQNSDGKYCTAAAIYNRALSDVEIEEMRAFLKTLEVA